MGRHPPLGTKSCVPRLPGGLVRRPRLEAVLAPGRRRPVTLVTGPPGAGKTTLLASWAASEPGRFAWLSVDQRDNRARRLAELVVATLGRAGALGPDEPTGPPGDDSLLDAAFERVMARGTRCVLVLDDVQELRSRPALGTLAHLVDRAPAGLDLVLLTRADPPVGLGRLRLDDRLAQIRDADLSFRPEEAARLLAAHGVALGPGEIRALCGRTGGWAAGLRLAACMLQSEPDARHLVARAAATEAAMSDYLLSEVLLRQDEAAQQFLLRTSVAGRLTPELAEELTGEPSTRRHLAELERLGLFLVEAEGVADDVAYRYHALFGALLRARLRRQDPELLAALHRRVAAWHLARDLPAEAEDHARAAGDWGLVGELVLRRWVDATLEDEWPDEPLSGVPSPAVLRTPALALVAAADACRRGDRGDADLYRSVVDGASGGGGDRGDGDRGRGGAGAGEGSGGNPWPLARHLLEVAHGRAFGDGRRARTALAVLGAWPVTDPEAPRARPLARLRAAELDLDAGATGQARRSLEDLAGELAGESDRPWLEREAAALLAVLEAASGRPMVAERWAAALLAPDGDLRSRPAARHAAGLAAVLYRAQRAERQGAADALPPPGPPGELPSRPLRLVDRAVRAAVAGRGPFVVDLDLRTVEHPLARRALLALGVLEVVDPEGRALAVGGDGERAVAAGRRWLGGEAHRPAPPEVEAWLGGAPAGEPTGHPRTRIEAGLLAAVAAGRPGRLGGEDGEDGEDGEEVARRHLRAALGLAAATGVWAPFEAYAGPVRRLLWRDVAVLGPWAAPALDLVDRGDRPGEAALVEPLTDREREVLHHLPTLMSNTEIARDMHLSVNTVKTHLKAVYRKLGVEGRRQALLRGRELELL